jgi:hypothetical protein
MNIVYVNSIMGFLCILYSYRGFEGLLLSHKKKFEDFNEKIICSVKLAWTVQVSRKKNNEKIL